MYKPIYANKRNFLSKKDLVISFYTRRCRYNKCSFCSIPIKSSNKDVSYTEINQQIDWIWNKYKSEMDMFEQFSIGNEGSILDDYTFPSESLDYLLDRINQCKKSAVMSFETRAECITKDRLKYLTSKLKGKKIDFTIGLETQDDFIRNKILNKGLSKKTFESKICLLGEFGARLTSYVMLKPSPYYSENDGIEEAKKTIHYLRKVASNHKVDLIVYLCPVYIAKGSPLSKIMTENKYNTPQISSVFRIVQFCQKLKVPIYTGLWSEGLEEPHGAYRMKTESDKNNRGKILRINKIVPTKK